VETRASSRQRRALAAAKERVHSSLSTAGGEATRKPLVSRSRSSIHIVTRTFALLQKLCRGLKRARREKSEARDKVSRGAEAETRTAAAALRNFHFAGIVSARAPPGEMEAAKRR